MDHYEPGVALAVAQLAELHRQLTGGAWPAASPSGPQVGAGTGRQGRHGWARAARRRASVALWSSGATFLLAAVALLIG